MITIKEFAKVCKCNTQTLRYYDRIDLLKPAKVDEITGYRHYNISQVVDYVKIKNLQLAEFSIDEIKKLLEMSDDDIYGAFDEKIAFHKDRLAKIMEIQKSYLKEKSAMEKLIDNITKLIFSNTDEFDYIGEFGLETEDNEKMQNMVRGFLRQNTVSSNDIMLKMGDTVFQGIDTVLEKLDAIKPENLPKNMQIGDKDAVSESKTVDVKSKKEIWKKSVYRYNRCETQ